MINNWQGKTVVVTGAATGIGRAVSAELASRGAIVYVTALSVAACQPVVDDISAQGQRVYAAKLDVNNSAEFQQVLNQVVAEHGRLDVLVNNAGILYVGEFYEMEEAFIESLVQTNLTAVTIGTLQAYRIMKEQGDGTILNVASMGGFSPTPTMAAYAATKHGVLGLTHSLAPEAETFGVDIKAVCFGLVGSELFSHARIGQGDEQTVYAMLPVKPLTPAEAAEQFINQVASRKTVLFVPGYARLMWWINRLFPAVLVKGARDTIRKYRELVSGQG